MIYSALFGTFHEDSLFLAKGSGPLIPIDWVFLPIISLYNLAVSMYVCNFIFFSQMIKQIIDA